MHAVRSRHRFRAAGSLCAATSLLCFASTAAAQQDEARVQWKYAPQGSQFEDVLVGDGTVFGLDRAGVIHAIDAASGRLP